ncbi:hypothetical protein LTR10_012142 [Elasticomyces elasticus]|nr:hypothetical protein LTR10_012142 [Elasticomyces elasticus]KAK4969082.1 hypothetical protein LTR42_009361 [Elasticomyces elasticus]
MATPTPGVLRIPTEIRAEIASYLTSKEDLKALSLACKELGHVATQSLYEDMTIGVAALDATLALQLHAKNPGLRFIRRLRIHEGRYRNQACAYHHNDHGAALGRLLRVLPKDSLQSFQLNTLSDVPLEITHLLRTRQRTLANYQTHHLATNPKADITPDADDLKHVNSVQLYIRSKDDCHRANMILRTVPSIMSLDIVFSPDIKKLWQYCPDTAAVNRIFGIDVVHLNGNVNIHPRNLRLEGVRLFLAAENVAGAIDFDQLETLALEKCYATHALFNNLSESQHKLKTIANVHCYAEDEAESNFGRLLVSIEGLEGIKVKAGDSTARDSCSWAGIGRHGQTLKVLYMNDFVDESDPFDTWGWDRSLDNFKAMCKAFPKLQQLATWAPLVHERSWKTPGGFLEFLQCLSHLHKLRILRLFVYVGDLIPEGKRIHMITLKFTMQILANKIFKELSVSCPDLVGLVIDARDKYNDCKRRPVAQLGYLRGTMTDACGRREAMGVPIEADMIKHYEPCAEILDDDAPMT